MSEQVFLDFSLNFNLGLIACLISKKKIYPFQVLTKIILLLFKDSKKRPYFFIDYLIIAIIQPCLPVADSGYLLPLIPLRWINLGANIDLVLSPSKGKQSVNNGWHILLCLPQIEI